MCCLLSTVYLNFCYLSTFQLFYLLLLYIEIFQLLYIYIYFYFFSTCFFSTVLLFNFSTFQLVYFSTLLFFYFSTFLLFFFSNFLLSIFFFIFYFSFFVLIYSFTFLHFYIHTNSFTIKNSLGNIAAETLLLPGVWCPGLQKEGNRGNVFPANLRFWQPLLTSQLNSFRNKCPQAKMSYPKWRLRAKLV